MTLASLLILMNVMLAATQLLMMARLSCRVPQDSRARGMAGGSTAAPAQGGAATPGGTRRPGSGAGSRRRSHARIQGPLSLNRFWRAVDGEPPEASDS